MSERNERGLSERDSLGDWLGSNSDKYRHEEWNSDGRSTTYPSTLTPFERDVYGIVRELAELLIRKHKDYGPLNVANAPGGALNGLRVRIHDKVARLNHLFDKGVAPQNESVEDSYKDLANYAIIALLVGRGQWPSK